MLMVHNRVKVFKYVLYVNKKGQRGDGKIGKGKAQSCKLKAKSSKLKTGKEKRK